MNDNYDDYYEEDYVEDDETQYEADQVEKDEEGEFIFFGIFSGFFNWLFKSR